MEQELETVVVCGGGDVNEREKKVAKHTHNGFIYWSNHRKFFARLLHIRSQTHTQ